MDERTARSRHPDSIGQAFLWVLLPILLLVFNDSDANYAQVVVTNITSTTGAGNLGTTVTQAGNVYDITGGTRPGNGPNLFHSFGEFSVATNNIANFLNETALPTSNILGRVTGGNISNIFGAIQTDGFGNANLFLMNPAGFLFGPNATVNVGGMVSFTSADYLRLADSARFNAIPNATADALLTASPVASFGFLGSNPGAITVQGSQLFVTPGHSISLVGGNISIESGTPEGGTAQPARLSAPNGNILLASAASPGEFTAATLQSIPNVDGASFTSFGSVTLAPGSSIAVSGTNNVSIRDGEFVLSVNDAVLSTAVTAAAAETVVLGNGSAILASTQGSSSSGSIDIMAKTVQLNGSRVQTESLDPGIGDAGNITIAVLDTLSLSASGITSAASGSGAGGTINITGRPSVSLEEGSVLLTQTIGSNRAGDINLTVANLTMTGGSGIESVGSDSASSGSIAIDATDSILLSASGIVNRNEGFGGTGGIAIAAKTLNLSDSAFIRSDTFFGSEVAETPKISIFANDDITISSDSGIVVAATLTDVGAVEISSHSITVSDRGFIDTTTGGPGTAGAVTLNTHELEISGGGRIRSSTVQDSGLGGTITVLASGQVSVSGTDSGIFSDSASPVSTAQGGSILVSAQQIDVTNGGVISAKTTLSGNAGEITLKAGSVNIETGGQVTSSSVPRSLFFEGDEAPLPTGNAGSVTIQGLASPAQSVLIDGSGSGLFTDTQGTGAGGNIFVNANSVTLQNGGTLSAATSGTAPTAPGGTITVDANQVQLLTGGLITVATTGAGNAGSVTINAADSVTLAGQDSFALPPPSARSRIISNTSGSGNGGDVTITAEGVVSLTGNHSGIFTDTSGTGNAGNITIAADALTLNGFAQVQARALEGSEGRGGNIDVAARAASLTGNSSIHADTLGQGDAGNIRILGDESIMLSDFSSINNSSTGSDAGNAGQIWLTAPAIVLQNSQLASFSEGLGNAGNILLEAKTVTVGASSDIGSSDITALTSGPGRGGDITIRGLEGPNSRAGDVTVSGPSLVISTTTGDGHAGDIAVKAERFTLSDSGTFMTSTGGKGDAGNISIDANASAQVSFGFLVSSSDLGPGNAGEITITTPTLTVEQAGFISTSTLGTGNAGTITVNANSINMLSGGQLTSSSVNLALEFPEFFVAPTGNAGNVTIQGLASPAQSVLIDGAGSGIFTDTQGTGKGGSIFVNANSVMLQNGGTLSAATSGTADSATGGTITVNATQVELNLGKITAGTDGPGDAGAIHINATDQIALTNGAIIDSSASGGPDMSAQGNGGTITLHAPHISLSEDTLVSSSTLGPGNAGDVVLEAQSLIMSGDGTKVGRVISNTQGPGQGGNITVQGLEGPESAAELVQLTHGSFLFAQTIGGLTGAEGNAGSIHVQAARLVLDGVSQLSTAAQESAGGAGTVIVDATDSVHLSGHSSITSNSAGALGQAGDITITSPAIWLKGASFISTSTDLVGNAGNITLHTLALSLTEGSQLTSNSGPQLFPEFQEFLSGSAGSVTIQNQGTPAQSVLVDGNGSGIFTDTQGSGVGGNIFVNANSVTLQNGGTLSAETSGTAATATGGTITVHASQVLLNNQANITATSTRQPNKPNSGAGNAGTIRMTAEENIVLLGNSSIASAAEGEGNGGLVSLTAPSIEMYGNSNIGTSTAGLGNAGNIELQGSQVNFTESFVTTRTQAEGRGGNITIRGLTGEGSHATDVRLSDNSQLVSETIGDGENIQGAAGNILVETAQLNLSGGSLFNTASRGSTGAAGNITVNATDSLKISGFGTQLFSGSTEFSFGDAGHISISAPSVVIENSGGISTSTSLVGNAGTITVNTNNLQLLSGGHITSSSVIENPDFPEFAPTGNAGTVTIQGLASPAESVLIDGTGSGIFTETQGSGAGGNIFVNTNSVALQNGGTLSAKTSGTEATATGGSIAVNATNQVTMTDGASISASSTGTGNTGNIQIDAGNQFAMTNSTVTTEANQASGGTIKITTTPNGTVQLTDSLISASVLDDTGGGGSVNIDPQFVILQNSQILAQAKQGPGGNISITTNLLLPDANSVISASSEFGVNGTVTIQSPNAPGSGQVQPLGKSPLLPTSLLTQRCAALAGGEFSSFTVAGRDSLPTEPGSWLASPLAFGSSGFSADPVTKENKQARVVDPVQETRVLSLRQIAPAGFLTQVFAVDWSGCTS